MNGCKTGLLDWKAARRSRLLIAQASLQQIEMIVQLLAEQFGPKQVSISGQGTEPCYLHLSLKAADAGGIVLQPGLEISWLGLSRQELLHRCIHLCGLSIVLSWNTHSQTSVTTSLANYSTLFEAVSSDFMCLWRHLRSFR